MSGEVVVAILGGSLSGNKGAASMLLAVADGIRARFPDARIKAFSPYPEQDRLRQFDGEILDFTPRAMMLRVFPLAVLCLLTLRRWRPTGGVAGEMASAHVAMDVSGVAFMDGRGIVTLGYNMLLVLLPWSFGVPVFKMAQALGPFEEPLNRLAARLVLPRADWIGLRGSQTERNVAGLELENTEPVPDVSFLLEVDSDARHAATAELPKDRTVTLVAPSAVLEQQCRSVNVDYVARISRLLEALSAHGHEVVLIAHSARQDASAGHTNDLPVCRAIGEMSSVRFVDREVDAQELRALIGRARLLVTSRFHAMISGLATGTPTFVLGWSHKYDEVLSEFELSRWSMDIRDASDDSLFRAIKCLDESSEQVRATIESRLPSVRLRAERNLIPAMKVLAEVR